MASDDSFSVKLSVEDGTEFFPPKEVQFVIQDSIFDWFPSIEVIYSDVTGLALEYGTFLQGVKLHLIYGEQEKPFDLKFRTLERNVIKATGSRPQLSGVIQARGVHESYFSDRKNPKKCYNKKPISDCIKDLFSSEKSLEVEATQGKVNVYAYKDPYEVAELFLDLASTGKIDKFVFFRDLEKKLHFCSLNHLLEGSQVATFELKAVLDHKDNEQLIINGFMPFNEKGDKVYPFMRVSGRYLTPDMEFKQDEFSIAKDAKDKIPFVSEKAIENDNYFGREFNPAVEYENVNKGLAASSMKFILDKAICIVPFNAKCVAGKVVELKVNYLTPDGSEELSEYYSGNWLIEQSFHSWEGNTQRATTRLILARKEVKPVSKSSLTSKAFKDT